jgi:hypothetical protein
MVGSGAVSVLSKAQGAVFCREQARDTPAQVHIKGPRDLISPCTSPFSSPTSDGKPTTG